MAAFEVSLKDAVSGAAKMAGGSIGDLMNSFAGLASGSQSAQETVNGLADMLGALGPEGKAAAEAIKMVTAVIFGLVNAMVAGAEAAIAITQERDKLKSTFDALSKGGKGGQATVDMLDKLAQKLPFTTQQLGEMAKGLAAAGLQGKDLEEGVKAIAAATALMGEQGGKAAEEFIKKLAVGGEGATQFMKAIQSGSGEATKMLSDMGLRIEDVASAAGMTVDQFKKAKMSAADMQKAMEKALQKKGKGPLEDMALTFPVMIAKLKEGFFSLFEKLGPAVKPFMKAIKELFGLFGKGGGIMGGLQGVVTKVFTVIFGWATRVVGAVKEVIQGFMGAGKSGSTFNKIGEGIKTLWNSLKAVFGTLVTALTPVIGALKAIFANAMVLNGIKTIFKVIAVVIGVVIVVIAAVVAAFIFLAATITAAIAATYGAVLGLVGVIADFASQAIDALSGWASGAMAAASNFISGLVDGITGGAGAVIAAITGIASGAVGAFKAALGIASPSKVMMQMGDHTTSGLAGGIENGTDAVAEASKGMGAAVTDGASDGASGGKGKGAGGKGGITVNIESGAIQISGASGDVLELTEEAVTAIFERIALQQGLVT